MQDFSMHCMTAWSMLGSLRAAPLGSHGFSKALGQAIVNDLSVGFRIGLHGFRNIRSDSLDAEDKMHEICALSSMNWVYPAVVHARIRIRWGRCPKSAAAHA